MKFLFALVTGGMWWLTLIFAFTGIWPTTLGWMLVAIWSAMAAVLLILLGDIAQESER